MKRLTSKPYLLIASVFAGMLFCIPAVSSGDTIRGEILAVDTALSRLVLMNAATATPISVAYNENTAVCGHGKGGKRGCCIRQGHSVEIEGAFSHSDATLFSATSIRGDHRSKRHDPTGVRSRLQSCMNSFPDPRQP